MSLSLVLAYSLSLTLITSLTCGLSHSFSELAVSFLSHSLCLFLDWSSLSHRGCLLYSLMVVALSLSRCLLSRPLPHSLSLSLPPPPAFSSLLSHTQCPRSLIAPLALVVFLIDDLFSTSLTLVVYLLQFSLTCCLSHTLVVSLTIKSLSLYPLHAMAFSHTLFLHLTHCISLTRCVSHLFSFSFALSLSHSLSVSHSLSLVSLTHSISLSLTLSFVPSREMTFSRSALQCNCACIASGIARPRAGQCKWTSNQDMKLALPRTLLTDTC